MLAPQSTAFLFPGQGSQTVGMGQSLAAASPAARKLYEQANDLLKFNFSALCWNGPEAELNDTHNTQPALYVCSLAALAALHDTLRVADFAPAFMAGHSLGEATALVAAMALEFDDGLELGRERGRLMKKAGALSPGGMAAVLNLDAAVLAEVCAEASAGTGQRVQVANDNCPGQVVISGDSAALEKAMELAKARGAKRAIKLPVSIAAHSPLMSMVADEYARFVDGLPFIAPLVSVIANTSVQPLADGHAIRAELVSQLTRPVRWTETIRYLVAQGVTNFVELGSKDVLTGLVKRIAPEATCFAVGTPEAVEQWAGVNGQ
ncbi:MAG: ACP S-malonyltransferase [Chloroflexi bacterium]|nr:ACP S-malonyltransferase [Chloroflexota bacterium]